LDIVVRTSVLHPGHHPEIETARKLRRPDGDAQIKNENAQLFISAIQIYFDKVVHDVATNSAANTFIDLYACAAFDYFAHRLRRRPKNVFSDDAGGAGSKIGVSCFSRR
jgi:hypothetical protein